MLDSSSAPTGVPGHSGAGADVPDEHVANFAQLIHASAKTVISPDVSAVTLICARDVRDDRRVYVLCLTDDVLIDGVPHHNVVPLARMLTDEDMRYLRWPEELSPVRYESDTDGQVNVLPVAPSGAHPASPVLPWE